MCGLIKLVWKFSSISCPLFSLTLLKLRTMTVQRDKPTRNKHFFSFFSTYYVAQIKLTECRFFAVVVILTSFFILTALNYCNFTCCCWLVFFFFFCFTFSSTFPFSPFMFLSSRSFSCIFFCPFQWKMLLGKLKAGMARIWQQISLHSDNKKELNLNSFLLRSCTNREKVGKKSNPLKSFVI